MYRIILKLYPYPLESVPLENGLDGPLRHVRSIDIYIVLTIYYIH